MTAIKISTALKKLRTDRQLSQPQLAKAMSCSKTTIQKYEKAGADPQWSFIERWLTGCGSTPVDLVRALGLEVAFEPPSSSPEEIPSEVVLGFGGDALRRAQVRRVGLKVALIDAAEGHAVVQTAPNYESLLSSLPPGTVVFEGIDSA